MSDLVLRGGLRTDVVLFDDLPVFKDLVRDGALRGVDGALERLRLLRGVVVRALETLRLRRSLLPLSLFLL